MSLPKYLTDEARTLLLAKLLIANGLLYAQERKLVSTMSRFTFNMNDLIRLSGFKFGLPPNMLERLRHHLAEMGWFLAETKPNMFLMISMHGLDHTIFLNMKRASNIVDSIDRDNVSTFQPELEAKLDSVINSIPNIVEEPEDN